jgi:hypothetical protein
MDVPNKDLTFQEKNNLIRIGQLSSFLLGAIRYTGLGVLLQLVNRNEVNLQWAS